MLIVDAGPLYAAAARKDRNHQRSVDLLSRAKPPLLVPELVVTEVCYLLSDRIGAHAELAFTRSITAGELIVEPVLASEWDRVLALTEQYLDLPLGVVDASVVVLAERHGATSIATLDHRHFSVVRPKHAAGFKLLP
ncbi:MAG: type II toxin-antitoxin system VapC family toxin [Acidimicrobiales bacterium]